MRIAVAQMSTRSGDFEGTLGRMVDYARGAKDQGAELVVFPLTTLTGPSPVTYVDREGLALDLAEVLMRLVDEVGCPCIVPVVSEVYGMPVTEALLLRDGDITPIRLTTYLEGLAAGSSEGTVAQALPEFEVAGTRFGLAFTYEDLDDYDEYEYDVDVVLFVSSYGFAVDDVSSAMGTSITEGRFLADASATGAWIVGVGSLGCYDAQVFTGSSFVLAPWGELAAQAPSFEEALLVCDVDPHDEGPLKQPLVPEVFDSTLVTWDALSLGLQVLCEQMGSSDAAVIVDGTLGSMTVATLATDALGPMHVHALVLPTGDRGLDAASERLCHNLRVDARTAPVEGGGDAALARDLAEARLAALARETHAVALGNADKTSLCLEDAPGTSAARILPLGDLYRTDVIALAHLRNTISPVIPPNVDACYEIEGITSLLRWVMPSAETRLQFVDLVLSSYVEWEYPLSDIVEMRGHKSVVEAIVRRLRDNEVSRAQRGICIAVSSKTLSEARAPYGMVWRDRYRTDDERVSEDDLERLDRSFGGEDDQAHDRDLSDLLGYLQDFSQGGAFSGEDGLSAGGGSGGRHSSSGHGLDSLWGSPFSEN